MLCILTCSAQGLLAGGPHSTGTRISVSLRKVPLVQSWTLPSVFGNLPRAVTLCGAASASPHSPPPFLVLSRRLSPHGENATMSPARMLCLALRPADPGGARMVLSTGRGGEGESLPRPSSHIVTHPPLTSPGDSQRSLDTFIRPFLGALRCAKALEQGRCVSLHFSFLFLPLFWSRLLSFLVWNYKNGDKRMLVRAG